MSGSQIFVVIFAIVSAAVTVLAIWRITKACEVRYKSLWVIGSLFEFVGFATSLGVPGDLYMQFGIQIPVLMMRTTDTGALVLKALFPVMAAVALVKFCPPDNRNE